jgi:hypothetical protein
MSTRTKITLSPELLSALGELAAAEGLTISALLTMLLNEALARRLARR